MNWGKIGIYTLIVLGVLGAVALVGWGLSSWSNEQMHVGEPELPASEATVTPSPTLTPGWWDSPLAVPTQPKK
jgi:hypothetical protein